MPDYGINLLGRWPGELKNVKIIICIVLVKFRKKNLNKLTIGIWKGFKVTARNRITNRQCQEISNKKKIKN